MPTRPAQELPPWCAPGANPASWWRRNCDDSTPLPGTLPTVALLRLWLLLWPLPASSLPPRLSPPSRKAESSAATLPADDDLLKPPLPLPPLPLPLIRACISSVPSP
jgi:hypothetical protein